MTNRSSFLYTLFASGRTIHGRETVPFTLGVSDPTGKPGGLPKVAPCGLGQAPMLTSPRGARTAEPLSGGASVRTSWWLFQPSALQSPC